MAALKRLSIALALLGMTLSSIPVAQAQFTFPVQPLGRIVCTYSAVPNQVRSEGLAERVGDARLDCTNDGFFNPAIPNNMQQYVLTNITISLNTAVTNMLEVGVEDFEKGRADRLTEHAWLTDDTISRGSWCYTEDLKIKSTREVLHVLIDIVAKNGQLLLNVSPKADGTIPENQQDVLLGIGRWLGKNGEAIYGTRPWRVFGEGPTRLEKGGAFVDVEGGYTPEDVRFTRKGDTLYAVLLGWPGVFKEIVLESFSREKVKGDFEVTGVSMLGSVEGISWKMREDGLAVTTPGRKVDEVAVVFRIETTGAATLRKENNEAKEP